MRLLVSVASAEDASAALAGGADLIDAKNPAAGALGSVSIEVLRQIHIAVAGARPVTAALGDANDETEIELAARAFTSVGALFVKVGFGGITDGSRVATLIAAASRGARTGSQVRAQRLRRAPLDGAPSREESNLIAVAYADAPATETIPSMALIQAAADAGAAGVLLDTADKSAPGLRDLIAPRALAAWVDEAHGAGLLVALAGKLAATDLPFIHDAGADIVGVRGAACDGGRTGRVSAQKVRDLRSSARSISS